MPLRDARPWIHDMDCSVGGLASCNIFYAKQIALRYKNYYHSNNKQKSTPAKKRSEINQQEEETHKTQEA